MLAEESQNMRRATKPGGFLGCVLAAALLIAALGPIPIAWADPQPALSAPEIATILKRMKEIGRTRSMPAKITEPLGASHHDETLTAGELVFEHDDYQHGFYKILAPGGDILTRGDDRFILVLRTPQRHWMAFLANARLELVSAVQWQAGGNPEPAAISETRSLFDNEIAYWAALAEIL